MKKGNVVFGEVCFLNGCECFRVLIDVNNLVLRISKCWKKKLFFEVKIWGDKLGRLDCRFGS